MHTFSRKLSFVIAFAIVLYALPAYAAGGQSESPLPILSVASGKIDSQDGHTLALSFDLVSERGVFAGIHYGVELVQATKSKRQTAYQNVFPETLSIRNNTQVHKEIVVTLPKELAGSYEVWVDALNSSGVVFGATKLGNVKLTADQSSATQEKVVAFQSYTSKEPYSIDAIISDKVDYEAGDSLSLYIETSSRTKDIVPGPNASTTAPVASVLVHVTDQKGNVCAKDVESRFKAYAFSLEIPIISACPNPVISATLKINGGVAAQKTYMFSAEKMPVEEIPEKATASNTLPRILLAVSVVILLIALLLRMRNRRTTIVAVFFLVSILIPLRHADAILSTSAALHWVKLDGGMDPANYAFWPSGQWIVSISNGTLENGIPTFNPGEPIAIGVYERYHGRSEPEWTFIRMTPAIKDATPPLQRTYTDFIKPWSTAEAAAYPLIPLDSTQYGINGISFIDPGNTGNGTVTLNGEGGMYAPSTPGDYYIHFAWTAMWGRRDITPSKIYFDETYAGYGRYYFDPHSPTAPLYLTLPLRVRGAPVKANSAPTPPVITGPASGFIETRYPFTFTSTDPDGDKILYQVNWEGREFVKESIPSTDYLASGTAGASTTSFVWRGPITIKARAKDDKGNTSAWASYAFPIINRAPSTPVIAEAAANTRTPAVAQTFTFKSTDPDNDDMTYSVNWGDGSATTVSALIRLIGTYTVAHTYQKTGTYTVTAKAKDNYQPNPLESNQSVYTVRISATQQPIIPEPTPGGGPGGGPGGKPNNPGTPVVVNPKSALCYPTKDGVNKTSLARVGQKIVWVSNVTPDPNNTAGVAPTYKYTWSNGLTGISALVSLSAGYASPGKYTPHLKVTGSTKTVESDCSSLTVVDPQFEEI